MKLKEIIDTWQEKYTPETECNIIAIVEELKLATLTGDIADLLALSISDHYNNLARTILEKEYAGHKINLQKLNQFLINKSEDKSSLLHYTAEFGNKDILIYFLNNGIEISVDKDSMTPIHSLSFARNLNKKDILEIIDKFESISPDIINRKDDFNLSPLHYAAHYKNDNMLKALIERQAKK